MAPQPSRRKGSSSVADEALRFKPERWQSRFRSTLRRAAKKGKWRRPVLGHPGAIAGHDVIDNALKHGLGEHEDKPLAWTDTTRFPSAEGLQLKHATQFLHEKDPIAARRELPPKYDAADKGVARAVQQQHRDWVHSVEALPRKLQAAVVALRRVANCTAWAQVAHKRKGDKPHAALSRMFTPDVLVAAAYLADEVLRNTLQQGPPSLADWTQPCAPSRAAGTTPDAPPAAAAPDAAGMCNDRADPGAGASSSGEPAAAGRAATTQPAAPAGTAPAPEELRAKHKKHKKERKHKNEDTNRDGTAGTEHKEIKEHKRHRSLQPTADNTDRAALVSELRLGSPGLLRKAADHAGASSADGETPHKKHKVDKHVSFTGGA